MEGKEYNDWKNFGIRVKNSRNSIGMTVEKLAEKSGRTENFIFKIIYDSRIDIADSFPESFAPEPFAESSVLFHQTTSSSSSLPTLV